MSTSDWESLLTPHELHAYKQFFQAACTSRNGIVSGQDAVHFFARSGVPKEILSDIWDTADRDNLGYLTLETFSIALKLIACTQHGHDIEEPILKTAVPLPQFEGFHPSAFNMADPATVILPAEREKYLAIFRAQHPVQGLLSNETARNVFAKSRLPNDILQQIWNLADVRKSGNLNQTEFVIAMHYIAKVMDSTLTTVPSQLPSQVYAAAAGSIQSSPVLRRTSVSPTRQFTGPSRQHIDRQRAESIDSLGNMAFSTVQETVVWDVTAQEKAQYDQFFDNLDPHHTGAVEGKDTVEFFSKSNLPANDLAQIWELADIGQKGRLLRDEFAVALHLINKRLRGEPLPHTLSKTLAPPSSRGVPPRPSVTDTTHFFQTQPVPSPQTIEPLVDDQDLLGDFDNSVELTQNTNEINRLQYQISSLQNSSAELKSQKGGVELSIQQLEAQKQDLKNRTQQLEALEKEEREKLLEVQKMMMDEQPVWNGIELQHQQAQQELETAQIEMSRLTETLNNGRSEGDQLRKQVREIQQETNALLDQLERLRRYVQKQNEAKEVQSATSTAPTVEKEQLSFDDIFSPKTEHATTTTATPPVDSFDAIFADWTIPDSTLPEAKSPEAKSAEAESSQAKSKKQAPRPPPPPQRRQQQRQQPQPQPQQQPQHPVTETGTKRSRAPPPPPLSAQAMADVSSSSSTTTSSASSASSPERDHTTEQVPQSLVAATVQDVATTSETLDTTHAPSAIPQETIVEERPEAAAVALQDEKPVPGVNVETPKIEDTELTNVVHPETEAPIPVSQFGKVETKEADQDKEVLAFIDHGAAKDDALETSNSSPFAKDVKGTDANATEVHHADLPNTAITAVLAATTTIAAVSTIIGEYTTENPDAGHQPATEDKETQGTEAQGTETQGTEAQGAVAQSTAVQDSKVVSTETQVNAQDDQVVPDTPSPVAAKADEPVSDPNKNTDVAESVVSASEAVAKASNNDSPADTVLETSTEKSEAIDPTATQDQGEIEPSNISSTNTEKNMLSDEDDHEKTAAATVDTRAVEERSEATSPVTSSHDIPVESTDSNDATLQLSDLGEQKEPVFEKDEKESDKKGTKSSSHTIEEGAELEASPQPLNPFTANDQENIFFDSNIEEESIERFTTPDEFTRTQSPNVDTPEAESQAPADGQDKITADQVEASQPALSRADSVEQSAVQDGVLGSNNPFEQLTNEVSEGQPSQSELQANQGATNFANNTSNPDSSLIQTSETTRQPEEKSGVSPEEKGNERQEESDRQRTGATIEDNNDKDDDFDMITMDRAKDKTSDHEDDSFEMVSSGNSPVAAKAETGSGDEFDAAFTSDLEAAKIAKDPFFDDDEFESAFSGQLSDAKIVTSSSGIDPEFANFDEVFNVFETDSKEGLDLTGADKAKATTMPVDTRWKSSFDEPRSSEGQSKNENGNSDENWDAIFGQQATGDQTGFGATQNVEQFGFQDAFSNFGAATAGEATVSSDKENDGYGRQGNTTMATESKAYESVNDAKNRQQPTGFGSSNLDQLVAMGFDRKDAKEALDRYDQDMEKATNFLLDFSSK